MQLNPGNRVVLKSSGATGTVTSVLGQMVYVAFDGGSSSDHPAADLALAAPETKTWPPEGIERK